MGVLYGLLDPIGKYFGSVLGTAWEVISGFSSIVGGFVTKYIIEPIMNFLGFTDENIYMTDVKAVKVFQGEDLLKKVQLDLATKHLKNDTGQRNFALGFAETGDAQFGKFYRHGMWDYTDHLPEVVIQASTIPINEVKSILESKIGNPVHILDVLAMVPYDGDWCKWLLQERYGYDAGEDSVTIDNTYCTYGSTTYVSSSNTFRVTLNPISIVTEKIYNVINSKAFTSTAITTKVFKITKITTVGTTKHTKHTKIYNRTIKTHNESGYVLSTVNVIISEVDETVKTPINTTTSELLSSVVSFDKDVQRVTTSIKTLYYRTDTNSFLSSTTTNVSDEYYITDLGSATTSLIRNIVSDTQINTGITTPKYITLENHNNARRYVITYTNTNNGRMYYWIYDPATNQYPSLTHPVTSSSSIESYPIVMLRNGFFDVENYNVSSIGGVSRPPSITEKRYKDTVELLNHIGVDLESLTTAYKDNPDIDKLLDAFFMYGVSPSDSSEITSRVLYEMFDAIYDKTPYIEGDSTFSASFKENPYNAAIVWKPKTTKIEKQVIGSLGKCTHSIINNPVTKTTYLDRTVKDRYVTDVIEEVMVDSRGNILGKQIKETTTYRIDEYDTDSNGNSYSSGRYKQSEITESNKDLEIKKQITETEVKILTCNSFTSFNIIRRGSYSGGVSLQLDDPDLVIPLPVEVVERLTLMEKTDLLCKAAYLTFYAYERIHLEWYETEKFASFLKILVIAISVVVTIISLGTASWATMTWSAAMFAVLKAVAIGVALQLALKLIMDNVDDPALKAVLAAAATAVAIYAGGGFDNFNGLTALKLVELPVQAASIYMNSVNEKLFDNLNDDMKSFSSAYKTRSEHNTSLINSFNQGLDVSNVTELMVGGMEDVRDASLLSPTQFYEMAVGGYRNYDTLYSGLYDSNVHDFCNNRLRLGIIQDGG